MKSRKKNSRQSNKPNIQFCLFDVNEPSTGRWHTTLLNKYERTEIEVALLRMYFTLR